MNAYGRTKNSPAHTISVLMPPRVALLPLVDRLVIIIFGGSMSQYYVPEDLEKNIGWHIPFTPYFFYRDPDMRIWRIVEKELATIHEPEKPYAYRFL